MMTIQDTSVYCAQGPQYLGPTGQGILTGYQFVFKDLFDVEGFVTGAGNPTWLTTHLPAVATSPLIERCLSLGAECLGRVQTDELAYSLNGQNCHYGTPVNPAAPHCIPGGSSSGSAVAVARGEVDFSLGTDTGGSVRVPASYCGLFGLRPTLGALSLAHCFELAKSFDTAGVLAANLETLTTVWNGLGAKAADSKPCTHLYLDKQCLSLLSKPRLAAIQQYCLNAQVALVEGDWLAENHIQLAELSDVFRTVQGYEIAQLHGEWLQKHITSLDPAIAERATWALEISAEQYQQGVAKQQQFSRLLMSQLQDNQCFWLLPTTPSGPPPLDMPAAELANYRSYLMGLTSIAGLSGLPQLHIPLAGLAEGPCGFSLLGDKYQETGLLALASMMEKGI
ncbi:MULTISPECIES: amidase family protein [unclassified Vibrio]|uniref:Amidase family protein n=1 Tax=Vibrio sp. HB236076 TaxID=3232307 RepID=A0AB39HL01_9VIBR|nr:amidase family protein [Vibrio sp. HB161653]MDP5252829.1 amidase family protein [Vibrio sp. HB161653]